MREQRMNNQQTIKEENIKTLFNLISAEPGVTRAQLGRVTSLSPTTVSTLVDELVQRGRCADKDAISPFFYRRHLGDAGHIYECVDGGMAALLDIE